MKYPQYFTDPLCFNLYLAWAVGWRLDSVPAIFRDCYTHFPISADKQTQLDNLSRPVSKKAWHWPMPPFPDPEQSTFPPQRASPDKDTFVRAMEYAHSIGDLAFAREVWFYRESWRGQLHYMALTDLQNVRWAEYFADDIIRYEQDLVNTYMSGLEKAKSATRLSEMSDEASNTLYEGYIRLLYIQTLTAAGECDEAFAMVLQGTEEAYSWTAAMLAKVKTDAAYHGHSNLVGYIESLETYGEEGEMKTVQNDLLE